MGVVVEGAGWNPGELSTRLACAQPCSGAVTNVSETIPLCPALRVEMIYIVVGNVLCQGFDLVLEALSSESRRFWVVQGPTKAQFLARHSNRLDTPYLIGTISPVLISLAAAALTLVGVRRFKRPTCGSFQYKIHLGNPETLTMSFSPQTQAVGTPSGPYFAWGTSFRRGNFVELGSNGMAAAVLFMVRKSLICANLL